MIAIPSQRWPDPAYEYDVGRRIEAAAEDIFPTINADSMRVAALLQDDDVLADGIAEDIAVAAMNAWPVIEKLSAGLPLTRSEEATFPALFRAIRPVIDKRNDLVIEAAQDQVRKAWGLA